MDGGLTVDFRLANGGQCPTKAVEFLPTNFEESTGTTNAHLRVTSRVGSLCGAGTHRDLAVDTAATERDMP